MLQLSSGSYIPVQHEPSPAMLVPQSLFVEPGPTSQTLQLAQPLIAGRGLPWSPELQATFETCLGRLTAAAGLPLSWVDNPEWIDFVHRFLPDAKSPSRKVLTTRLIPQAVKSYREIAKGSSKGQNATIQADGWTGSNFHHLLAFMITVNKKVSY
jgi:hypothetical protein